MVLNCSDDEFSEPFEESGSNWSENESDADYLHSLDENDLDNSDIGKLLRIFHYCCAYK